MQERDASARVYDHDQPVVLDPTMQHIYQLLDKVAVSSLPVLLLGETGTGKEVIAHWVHKKSVRGDRPLLRISCAGLTESVVESELFGHERGAFTGALAAHQGVFEAADGGTLFLDEIGELPLRTQAKLLRVLELGEFTRVGSTQVRKVDVRFVAATHRNLLQLIASGEFRSDLYYRLNGLSITIPALRQRPSELGALAQHFLTLGASKLGRSTPLLHPSALAALKSHDWPGNIRELRNVMERAATMCAGSSIGAELLVLGTERPTAQIANDHPRAKHSIRSQLRAFERDCIARALDQTGGNQTQAARLLGVSRRTLTNRLNALGLERPRKAPAQRETGS